jgi:hypothetical protein
LTPIQDARGRVLPAARWHSSASMLRIRWRVVAAGSRLRGRDGRGDETSSEGIETEQRGKLVHDKSRWAQGCGGAATVRCERAAGAGGRAQQRCRAPRRSGIPRCRGPHSLRMTRNSAVRWRVEWKRAESPAQASPAGCAAGRRSADLRRRDAPRSSAARSTSRAAAHRRPQMRCPFPVVPMTRPAALYMSPLASQGSSNPLIRARVCVPKS